MAANQYKVDFEELLRLAQLFEREYPKVGAMPTKRHMNGLKDPGLDYVVPELLGQLRDGQRAVAAAVKEVAGRLRQTIEIYRETERVFDEDFQTILPGTDR
jgi:hypothetical protein